METFLIKTILLRIYVGEHKNLEIITIVILKIKYRFQPFKCGLKQNLTIKDEIICYKAKIKENPKVKFLISTNF